MGTTSFLFAMLDYKHLTWIGDLFIMLSFFTISGIIINLYGRRKNVHLRRVLMAFFVTMMIYGLCFLVVLIHSFIDITFFLKSSRLIAGLSGMITIIVLAKNFKGFLEIPAPTSLLEEIKRHQETQKQLKVSVQKFQLVMKFAPIAMALIDLDGKWMDVNKAFVKMMGYTEEELLNLTFRQINHPEDETKGLKELQLLRDGKLDVHQIEKRYVHKTGKTIWVKISVVPIKNDLKDTDYFIVQINDITKRREAEQKILNLNKGLEKKVEKRTAELLNTNEDLENFVYTVTHDLRLPLRTLLGLSQVLREDLPKDVDEDILETVGYIEKNVQKLDQVILDLLAFSRAGKRDVKIVQFDMRKMMQETFEEVKADYSDKEIVFTQKEMPLADGDESAIKQICQNLLSNALKYASKKEKIMVEVAGWEEGGKNIYSVKDNGTGFDEKRSHKLFALFQRLHKDSEFKGTGLGLSVCKKIIRKHGGDIWAKGEVGKGATFYFSLPKQK